MSSKDHDDDDDDDCDDNENELTGGDDGNGGQGGSSSSHTAFREIEIREQDRFLPVANIARIMKKVLPTNAKIAKDAKEGIQECVSEFISFITSEASDKCQQEKRKTINGDDILWAMSTLGFTEYVDPLKLYLAKYRESVKGEKPEKKSAAKAAKEQSNSSSSQKQQHQNHQQQQQHNNALLQNKLQQQNQMMMNPNNLMTQMNAAATGVGMTNINNNFNTMSGGIAMPMNAQYINTMSNTMSNNSSSSSSSVNSTAPATAIAYNNSVPAGNYINAPVGNYVTTTTIGNNLNQPVGNYINTPVGNYSAPSPVGNNMINAPVGNSNQYPIAATSATLNTVYSNMIPTDASTDNQTTYTASVSPPLQQSHSESESTTTVTPLNPPYYTTTTIQSSSSSLPAVSDISATVSSSSSSSMTTPPLTTMSSSTTVITDTIPAASTLTSAVSVPAVQATDGAEPMDATVIGTVRVRADDDITNANMGNSSNINSNSNSSSSGTNATDPSTQQPSKVQKIQ